MNASWENWAFQHSETCQQQIDAARKHAKFVLRDQNEEVLLINSLLRREIDELRRENEAYKQELMLHDQRSVGDSDLASLPENKPPAKRKALVTGKIAARAGSKRAKRRKGGDKKQAE